MSIDFKRKFREPIGAVIYDHLFEKKEILEFLQNKLIRNGKKPTIAIVNDSLQITYNCDGLSRKKQREIVEREDEIFRICHELIRQHIWEIPFNIPEPLRRQDPNQIITRMTNFMGEYAQLLPHYKLFVFLHSKNVYVMIYNIETDQPNCNQFHEHIADLGETFFNIEIMRMNIETNIANIEADMSATRMIQQQQQHKLTGGAAVKSVHKTASQKTSRTASPTSKKTQASRSFRQIPKVDLAKHIRQVRNILGLQTVSDDELADFLFNLIDDTYAQRIFATIRRYYPDFKINQRLRPQQIVASFLQEKLTPPSKDDRQFRLLKNPNLSRLGSPAMVLKNHLDRFIQRQTQSIPQIIRKEYQLRFLIQYRNALQKRISQLDLLRVPSQQQIPDFFSAIVHDIEQQLDDNRWLIVYFYKTIGMIERLQ